MAKKPVVLSLAAVITFAAAGVFPAETEGLYSPNPASRRQALIASASRGRRAVPRLGMALYDEDALVKRTALRVLIGMGRPARDIVRLALEHPEGDLKRIALSGLEHMGELRPEDLSVALRDSDEVLRLEAVRIVSGIEPRTAAAEELLRTASMDRMLSVREAAFEAIWDFTRLKEGEGFDRAAFTARLIDRRLPFRLPASGWKFRKDTEDLGRAGEWYLKDYDDSAWYEAEIEKFWEAGYIGVGWYRGWFRMPAKFDCGAVELHFGGVDESTWVWVNGQPAGSHDIGPSGWNVPFSLDITGLVKWGGENQITVRAMNTAHAGGIWKPIAVYYLKD